MAAMISKDLSKNTVLGSKIINNTGLPEMKSEMNISDYALKIKREGNVPEDFKTNSNSAVRKRNGNGMIVVGDLTITVDLSCGALLGIEAYTNFDKWEKKELVLPVVKDSGELCLTYTFPDDDRINIAKSPLINFDSSKMLLHIKVDDSVSDSFAKIGSGLYAGRSRGGQLTEFFIENLLIQN